MGQTGIEWASHSWNPYIWSCTKVSPGCKNCYAETLAKWRGMNFNAREVGINERFDRAMKELKGFKPGAVIFVNSMSDTYHELAPVDYIQRIHDVAAQHLDKTFLLLTKRPERALELSPQLEYPENLWVGASVENGDYLYRLNYLLEIPAAGHFLSAEPLLGALPMLERHFNEYRRPIKWIIVGGESGANRRPFDKDWAREIRDMCQSYIIPFMFKQGSAFKPGGDRLLDGRTWDETPFSEVPEPVVRPHQMSMFNQPSPTAG